SPGFRLVGLTDRNELARFTADAPGQARLIPIAGAGGRILGIDFRVHDRRIYGLGADHVVYRIDANSGAAQRVVAAGRALPADVVAVDYDPKADALRIITAAGGNFSVAIATGAVNEDQKLAYAANDRNAGKTPGVTAAAHINTYPGAFATQLFEIDSANGNYVVHNPIEAGRLRTVGPLGLPAGTRITAFDIITDRVYEYWGFAASGRAFYHVDVATGRMTARGEIGIGDRILIDLAIEPKAYPAPPSADGTYAQTG
ncbi:MAG: DUF4394 domain-containing protein, partial [Alphaproteobacteria bacterium]|nr:DUF4394 domain-containing protein [Alphaproteobacteria bacterium]